MKEEVGLQIDLEPGQLDVSPYSLFVGSIRSPVTREKYLQRMGYFFDYLNIDQTYVEKSFEALIQKARANPNWFVNAIFKCLHGHKTRVDRKEISSATLRNYVKPIRLYCEQMDIPIPWKKIVRGMPKGRRFANDRAPTLEGIRKVIGYPDRRIRPIICPHLELGSVHGTISDGVPVSRNNQIVAAKI
jgi:hypothetical protein